MREAKLLIGPRGFLRLGRVLGVLAVAGAALGVVPLVVSQVRFLLKIGYVEYYVVLWARDVLYASLFFGVFAWLHFTWRGNSLRVASSALGILVAVSAAIAGPIVWMDLSPPRFWFVWPTYGQDFQLGLCLWAVATSRSWNKLLIAAVSVTSCTLLLSSYDDYWVSGIGISATWSFVALLWLVGTLLSIQKPIAALLRAPLLVYLAYWSATLYFPGIIRLYIAVIVLTELRAVVTPLTPHGLAAAQFAVARDHAAESRYILRTCCSGGNGKYVRSVCSRQLLFAWVAAAFQRRPTQR